ncbi:hypothetical protein [uncultured Microscilla sp.]|uniref:hypothetical protein n=1 Tax=uncultured Microscilla sp. TaxID=432653 RepID=UPI00262DCA23|nr:hypothetical protein [uncultured Microscilla sp.]
MFRKIKWKWWNATGYRSRIARLRAERQRLEPTLNLGLPRTISKKEKEILNEELPNPTLPTATGVQTTNGGNNNTMIWGIVGGAVLLAGIIATIIIIKKRKGDE